MQPLSIHIDPTRCNGCKICVNICPARAFNVIDKKAVLTGSCSFACDHCAAACPQSAISVEFVASETFDFTSSPNDQGQNSSDTPISLPSLVLLMRSRRSCRLYQKKSVEKNILEDLVKIAITAPSGTNSQKWTFSIIDNRNRVIKFGAEIAAYFRKLNRQAELAWLRKTLKFCGRPELDFYFKEYFESVNDGLNLWYEKGEDHLFHGASATIIIGAHPGASCPQDDALLATQNILLAAENMGLGTCLIGFAVEAMRRDRKIQTTLNIPTHEKIYSVIALGYPEIAFQRPTARRKININWVD